MSKNRIKPINKNTLSKLDRKISTRKKRHESKKVAEWPIKGFLGYRK